MTWVKKSILTLSITAAVLGGACSWVLFTAESFETTADKVERLNTFEAKVAAVKLALKTKSRRNDHTPLSRVHLRLPEATGLQAVKAYASIDSAPKTEVFVGYNRQAFETTKATSDAAEKINQHLILHRCHKEGAPSQYREIYVQGAAYPYDNLMLSNDYFVLSLNKANSSRALVYDETGYARGLTLSQDFNAHFGALRSVTTTQGAAEPPPRAIASCTLSPPQIPVADIVAQLALSAPPVENLNSTAPPVGWSTYAARGGNPFKQQDRGQALQWVGIEAEASKADELAEKLGAFLHSKGYVPWEIEEQKKRLVGSDWHFFRKVIYRHDGRTTELSLLQIPGGPRVTLITF